MAASGASTIARELDRSYERKETLALVALVKEAAERIHAGGEAAFNDFRVPDSRWRQGESYIFVLDPEGRMLVHPDPALEGRNTLGLEDVNGKPIIRGLLAAATGVPGKPEGWYHYQWPVPGGLLPRWKSSYVRLVERPAGKRYVVGSGMYDDRMEKAFVLDLVAGAVELIEKEGTGAFRAFHDPKDRFLAKDAYIFVYDMDGTALVLPAFPNLEGKNLRDQKDVEGKYPVRDLLKVAQAGGGWSDYLWPKPGESVSTRKSTYAARARLGDKWVMVACGVYLAEAPTIAPAVPKLGADELVALVREAAQMLEKQGEQAFPELRRKGSKWLHDDLYFFVLASDGTRVVHAADPALEGRNIRDAKDILGRPYGAMMLDAGSRPGGEGWVHYMFPEPDRLFPAWKSTFVKQVTLPSGQSHIIGCGVYHMEMNEAFIEDLVKNAAALIEREGRRAFDRLRDRKGPFVFMDTYVFVDALDGTELVNGGQPSLEGRNLLDLRDLEGKIVMRDEIDAAMKQGSAWLDVSWYKPGSNTPAPKRTYVRKVQSGADTFIVGSGVYLRS